MHFQISWNSVSPSDREGECKMFTSISFQNITKLSSLCYADLESTPFFIQFESTENDGGANHYARGEVCLHIADAALARALVEAINNTVAEHNAKLEQQVAA